MKAKILVLLIPFSLGILFGAFSLQPASAHQTAKATIRITNPGELQVKMGEGDDYAFQVLENAWDMNQPEDIQMNIAFEQVSAQDGIWNGQYSGWDQANNWAEHGYIFPLFQGTPGAGYWNGESATEGYAADTSRFTRLSMRVYTTDRSRFAFYWQHQAHTWPTSDNYLASIDGCRAKSSTVYEWAEGWHIYSFKLNNKPGERSLLNDDGEVGAGSWQSSPEVFGLRFDPSLDAKEGTDIKVDWIRLSDPTSAPQIPFTWEATGTSPEDRIEVRVATDPNGSDALPLVREIVPSNGSYSLDSSLLPPGKYYFSLALLDGKILCGPNSTKASSAWVGPLEIAAAPDVSIQSPSTTSGDDYATQVLNNPWDMKSASDVITPDPSTGYPDTQVNEHLEGDVFVADAVIRSGFTQSDAQFWLNIDPNRPVDANKYRYFTIRYKLVDPGDNEPLFLIKHGWGARIVWWTANDPFAMTKYIPMKEGWQTYTLDLKRGDVQEVNVGSNPPWGTISQVPYLRFDAMEAEDPVMKAGANRFYVDWAMLTAMPSIRRGEIFDVQYDISPEQYSRLRVFYDTDRNPANGRTEIRPVQQANLQAGEGSVAEMPEQFNTRKLFLPMIAGAIPAPPVVEGFAFDTSQASPGTYYICLDVENSSGASTYRCSNAPLQILPAQ